MLPRLGFLGLLLVAACGSTGGQEEDGEKPPKPGPLATELPAGGTIHRTSRDISFQEMIEDLREADVVYLGEAYDNPDHHLVELRVLEYLAYYGRLHAIGMEMFQRRFQGALDDYVFGRTDEAEMLEATEYRKRGGRDYSLYRGILEFARARRIPVIALSVEDEIRAPVREGGRDALAAEQRTSLPAIDTRGYPEHRARARAAYDARAKSAASDGDEDFERSYLVTCLEEGVMAGRIVEWFSTAPDDGQIVVLAASDRVGYRDGIPDRVHERIGKRYRVVSLLAAGEEGPPLACFSKRYADYLWVTKAR